MNKKIIKIDVDGVLRDMLSIMCKIYNEHYNENIFPYNVTNYDVNISFPKCQEIDNISAKDFFFKENAYKIYNQASVIPMSDSAMRLLHNLGYYIVIVSCQKTYKNKYDTLNWLDENNIYYDSICFTNDKSIVKGDIMVDDCIDFLKQCNNNKEELICIKAPYNENDNYFKKFNSLFEYACFLEQNIDNLK
jgi:5'(3')-deoxyribonucleotidase